MILLLKSSISVAMVASSGL